MRMTIVIDVHVPDHDLTSRKETFVQGVIQTFRSIYPDIEQDYKLDGTPQVTVSSWNEDSTPVDMSYKEPETDLHETD